MTEAQESALKSIKHGLHSAAGNHRGMASKLLKNFDEQKFDDLVKQVEYFRKVCLPIDQRFPIRFHWASSI